MCILFLPERQLPVPLDKGNECSENEIIKAVGDQTHRARTQSNGCVVCAYDLRVAVHESLPASLHLVALHLVSCLFVLHIN